MPFWGCEWTTPYACIRLSGLFQIFWRRSPPIFWTLCFPRGSISPTWSYHHLLSMRLIPSSFTTALHHHVSQKLFANGMKSVRMHLSSDRSLRGFFSLSCYHTSLHPWCTGSKCRTCPSSNTSLSTSLRLALLQHPQAWLPVPSRPNTRPRMTRLVTFTKFLCFQGPEGDLLSIWRWTGGKP